MVSSIEQLESARDVEYPKFKLLPILSEGRTFVTLDNRGMKFLATHAKSRKYSKELDTSIDSKFQRVETFFDFEGVTKNPRKWRRGVVVRTNGIGLHIAFETLNTERLTSGRAKRKRANQKISPEDLPSGP